MEPVQYFNSISTHAHTYMLLYFLENLARSDSLFFRISSSSALTASAADAKSLLEDGVVAVLIVEL